MLFRDQWAVKMYILLEIEKIITTTPRSQIFDHLPLNGKFFNLNCNIQTSESFLVGHCAS